MKVLIVEDEQHLAEGLRFNLIAEGYEAEIAPDGEVALARLFGEPNQAANAEPNFFDAIVLDVMLPGINGFEVAARLRENNVYTPILMLTARSRAEDVLQGFAAGADDYLAKPFDLAIFLARLSGLLRRRQWLRSEKNGEPENVFKINDKTFDFSNLELKTRNEIVRLTLMEAKLLRHLIENAGRAVSRKEILEDVWELHEDTDTRAIDNFIVRLRRYLEDEPTKPKCLVTVRSIGYKFVCKD